MATRSLGSLTLDLIARSGGFEKGMDRAARAAQTRSRRIQREMRQLRRVVTRTLGGFAAAFGVREIQRFSRETIAMTSELGKAAQTADVSSESMQELRFAFEQLAGVGQRDVDLSLQRLNRRLGLAAAGGGPAVKAFERLGISIRDVGGNVRATESVLDETLAKLAEMESSAERAATASEIFGEDAGPRLASALRGGIAGLQEARDRARELGLVLSDDLVRGAEGADDRLSQLGQQLTTDFQRIVLENTETIVGLAEALSTLAGIAGGALGEFVDLGDRMGFMAASIAGNVGELDKMERKLEDVERALSGGFWTTPIGLLGKSREELEAMRESLQTLIDTANGEFIPGGGSGASGGSGGSTSVTAGSGFGFFETMRTGVVASLDAIKELRAETDALNDTFEQQRANYEQQIALTGEVTELERIRFEIARGGLEGITDAQADELEGLAGIIDANRELQAVMDRGREVTESLLTAEEHRLETQAELNDLLNAGAIGYDTYVRGILQAQQGIAEASEQFDTVRDQLMRNTQDIFADTLFSGFDDGLDGMLDSFRDTLAQMAAQAAAARLADTLFGNIGTGDNAGGFAQFLGNVFGGNRATGGPVDAGRLYRVNENEPEYFVPGTSGQVVPLSNMGGGNTFNFAIQAPQGTVSRETQLQMAESVSRALRGARRNQ